MEIEFYISGYNYFYYRLFTAGVIDGKLLDKNSFVEYATLGDLTSVRSGLVQLLQNAGGVNLNRQLNQHQSTLVSRLQQIASPEVPEEEKVE